MRAVLLAVALALGLGAGEFVMAGETRGVEVDQVLGGRERPFVRYPGTWSFGPTGARLWMNYINANPGFDGLADFIHKTNIPTLTRLDFQVDDSPVAAHLQDYAWYPSHSVRQSMLGPLELRESLFITWEDVAVEVVELTNPTEQAMTATMEVTSSLDFDRDMLPRAGTREIHSLPMRYVLDASPGLGPIEVPAGGTVRVVVALGMGLEGERLEARVAAVLAQADPLKEHRGTYRAWFAGAPSFQSSDSWLNRMWAYRWYLARRNLAAPDAGNMRHPLYYEGRAHKCSNTPWEPRGWDFAKLISFSTPVHVLEGMWHADVEAARGEVLTLVENQTVEGFFPYVTVHRTGSRYYHFIPWAVWQMHCCRPDPEFLAKVTPALARNVEAWLEHFDTDGDGLIEVRDHNKTGKEYQPSYWYFSDYPEDPHQDPVQLERVDATVYLIVNAHAVARLWGELGNSEEMARFVDLAARSRKALVEFMWDRETRFFYDVRLEDNVQAKVRNVVGFEAFLDEMLWTEYAGVFEELTNPETFGTEWPLPSVEINNPAFAPDASWQGWHLKGPHGAVWNGPTWPFTNSTALIALGNLQQRAPTEERRAQFEWLFRKYSELMQRDGQPMVVEHYNPFTGAEISQEEDYYHSAWIYLVMRYVVGLVPRSDNTLELRPIDIGLERFRCAGIPYRGYMVDVEWEQGSGYRVLVDGGEVGSRETLGVLTVELRRRSG